MTRKIIDPNSSKFSFLSFFDLEEKSVASRLFTRARICELCEKSAGILAPVGSCTRLQCFALLQMSVSLKLAHSGFRCQFANLCTVPMVCHGYMLHYVTLRNLYLAIANKQLTRLQLYVTQRNLDPLKNFKRGPARQFQMTGGMPSIETVACRAGGRCTIIPKFPNPGRNVTFQEDLPSNPGPVTTRLPN
jgi:hypothetical protein